MIALGDGEARDRLVEAVLDMVRHDYVSPGRLDSAQAARAERRAVDACRGWLDALGES